jgi:MscS family membrane protein
VHGADGRWVFTRGTVGRIDSWYARLDHGWLLEHLPVRLLRPGPLELLYWQWLALPVLFVVAWLLGYFLSRLTRRLFARIVRRTATRWDDEVFARVTGPLTLGWALAAAYALLPWLALYQPAQESVHRVLRAGFLLGFFWALLRSVDVAREVVAASAWARAHSSLRSLLPLGARVSKVLVLGLAVVAFLSELGYPVTSLVAGLGIGGLALALAAQKTVENLFGAFSIGADQPFREGDFVRIEDVVGTVETIGLRATRIRTLDRTLVSIPNGRLADMRLESFAARDRMRLACTIGLVYGTTAAQMRDVLDGLERVLRAHPLIWPDAVVVRFKEFGDSSLNVEVMAWFQTPNWSEFQLIRQDILLQFMDVVEKAGSSFAFPTRTVHLVSDDR